MKKGAADAQTCVTLNEGRIQGKNELITKLFRVSQLISSAPNAYQVASRKVRLSTIAECVCVEFRYGIIEKDSELSLRRVWATLGIATPDSFADALDVP